MLISTKAFYLSSKTKIVYNFLTMRLISILTLDLNRQIDDAQMERQTDEYTDRQTNRQTDGHY
jgi:hypothetical protein